MLLRRLLLHCLRRTQYRICNKLLSGYRLQVISDIQVLQPYYAMGEKFMAETYWRRALEAGADAKRIEQRMAISKSGQKGRVEELGAE